MKKILQQYIQKPVKNLSKKQHQYLKDIVLYLEKGERTIGLEELDFERVQLKKILIPDYNKQAKEKMKVEQALQDISNLEKIRKIIALNIDSYDQLKEYFQDDHEEIYDLLHQIKYLQILLGTTLFMQIFEIIKKMDERQFLQQKQIPIIQTLDSYFSIFLSSRYNLTEMEMITGVSSAEIDTYFRRKYIEQLYSEEIIEKIQQKKIEISTIKNHCKRSYSIIKDSSIIEIVQPYVTTVSSYQKKNLDIVVEFFAAFGNIEQMILENSDIPNYNYVLACVKDASIQKLLKEKYLNILNELLIAEQLFRQDIKIPDRKRLIEEAVLSYYTCNGSIYVALQNTNIPKFIFLRTLKDSFVKAMYGGEVYQAIQEAIEAYKEKQFVITELQKVKSL